MSCVARSRTSTIFIPGCDSVPKAERLAGMPLFIKAAASLGQFPEACGVATDAEFDEVVIREWPFKTPRGRNYRILFTIAGEEVLILRVRGPAQHPLTWGEFLL